MLPLPSFIIIRKVRAPAVPRVRWARGKPVIFGSLRHTLVIPPESRANPEGNRITSGLLSNRAERHALTARRIAQGGRVIPETRENDMGLKTLAPIGLFVSLTLTCSVRAQQSGRSVAPSPSSAWNDNDLITVQKTGGDPARPGDVKIEFYGHDAFKITSPAGLTVLTDPWRNDSTGLYPRWFLTEFPAIRVDIVLSTHAHFDHDARPPCA